MKYQLTCPKCKHEFTYDGGEIDAKIERLKNEITRHIKWLEEYKLMPKYKQNELRQTRYYKKKSLGEMQTDLQALKSQRKVANEHIQRSTLEIFAQLVRDEIGEKRYIELKQKAEQELEAYQLSGLMRHEYTRASSKGNVTNINKL